MFALEGVPTYLMLGATDIRVWSLALILGMIGIGAVAYPFMLYSRAALGRPLQLSNSIAAMQRAATSKVTTNRAKSPATPPVPVEQAPTARSSAILALQAAVVLIALVGIVVASYWAKWLMQANPFTWYDGHAY